MWSRVPNKPKCLQIIGVLGYSTDMLDDLRPLTSGASRFCSLFPSVPRSSFAGASLPPSVSFFAARCSRAVASPATHEGGEGGEFSLSGGRRQRKRLPLSEIGHAQREAERWSAGGKHGMKRDCTPASDSETLSCLALASSRVQYCARNHMARVLKNWGFICDYLHHIVLHLLFHVIQRPRCITFKHNAQWLG